MADTQTELGLSPSLEQTQAQENIKTVRAKLLRLIPPSKRWPLAAAALAAGLYLSGCGGGMPILPAVVAEPHYTSILVPGSVGINNSVTSNSEIPKVPPDKIQADVSVAEVSQKETVTPREPTELTELKAAVREMKQRQNADAEEHWYLHPERVTSHPQREDIFLNGAYKVSDEVILHSPKERDSIPLHLAELMERFKFHGSENAYVDRDLKSQLEAAGKGKDVLFVLEMPRDTAILINNQKVEVSMQDWEEYLHWILPQVKGKNIIIGNEMYTSPLTTRDGQWGADWSLYGEYFSKAYDLVKQIHPEMQITLSAPEYYKQGQILEGQIKAIEALNANRTEKIKIDRIALHFYGEPHKLPEYIQQNQEVLQKYPGWEHLPIDITEMGVPEQEQPNTPDKQNDPLKQFTDQKHAEHELKLIAMAAALVDEGRIQEAINYSSYSKVESPIHSLLAERDGKIVRKPAHYAYELAKRLFYKDVSYTMENNIVTVTGHMADGTTVHLYWSLDIPRTITLKGTPYFFQGNTLVPIEGLNGNQVMLGGLDAAGRTSAPVIDILPK